MQLIDILTPQRTRCGVTGVSKKRVLHLVSEVLAETRPEIDALNVFDHLTKREKLSSTGLGNGVAIPHGRCDCIEDILAVLIKTDDPIDFDSPDRKPVDLIFALLVPTQACDEHLQALSALAQLLDSEQTRQKLRAASDSKELYRLVCELDQPRASA
ncbi:PTS IIA-like nitrogen regulatory protein PtsN [Pelagibaculum spongiae]|uniref:PTS IIA-like nitrogen-regulatory protein PtsN n=1 Tax=Pelagibaculum spongiae TaxID=2080658 RepID=A0A2V1GXV6_9GAMM|nr:PTS IIA-like nitrogen regulatory protein PtsN [Pelagibaculum spongiae]PVZ71924.1 PTS IIA-like nitrogen-regulatory protein PtsN [Pelagibaculum spongiae]